MSPSTRYGPFGIARMVTCAIVPSHGEDLLTIDILSCENGKDFPTSIAAPATLSGTDEYDRGSALKVSPLTIPSPSKPRFVLTRIVGIEIDMYARDSAISKLKDVAETSTGSFASCPGLSRHCAV